jgi:hypothetical protein
MKHDDKIAPGLCLARDQAILAGQGSSAKIGLWDGAWGDQEPMLAGRVLSVE